MKKPKITEDFQADYFTKTLALYDSACVHSDSYSEADIVLADTHIKLCFVSSALRKRLFPALSHLEAKERGEETAEFTFYIWDSHSSGVTMMPPPCDRTHFTDRGDIWGFNSKRYRFAFHYGEFSFNLFDKKTKQGIFWVDLPHHLPYWTTAAPLRTLFHWSMEMKGCQLLHAAAIGSSEGAVLLTGEGGCGKSTTSLNGICGGMYFAGDDYVVAQLLPTPRVFTLYSSAKVNPDNVDGFVSLDLLKVYDGKDDEKIVFQLFPHLRQQIVTEMPLVGVLAPRIKRLEKTVLSVPENIEEIERAASFTTVSQLPYSDKNTYHFIEKMVQALPTFWLDLGEDREEVIEVIKQFIHASDVDSKTNNRSKKNVTKLPSLSVIIPVFNREKVIAETLENVFSQGYPEPDVIVVNDGSEDNTEGVVLDFNKKYDIRYFKQENSGPSQARNRGIVNSRSEFIAFLDSDDLWPPNILPYLVKELQSLDQFDVIRGYCQLAFKNSENKEYEFEGNPRESFPNYITGTVFRRSIFDRVGLFDKDLRFGEDNDWFNRAEELGVKVKRVSCTSVIVRRHEENMTKGKNLIELNVLRVFKKAIDRKRTLLASVE